MKKSAFLIMIVMLIIGSCVEEEVDEKLPLEGAGELVYGFPIQSTNSQMECQ